MVIIWLMMVKNNLIGGIPTPLKNMSSSDWIIITIGETKIHVPTHQPVNYYQVGGAKTILKNDGVRQWEG